MKTSKIIYLLFALILTTSAVVAQRSETRTPGTFNEIENSGSWDIQITKGPKDEIRLETKSFDLSKVITALEGRRLVIKLEKGNYKNVDIKVFVTVRELESVGNSGSGDMTLNSNFGANSFNLALSGSGSITAQNINAEELNIALNGSGEISIKGGQADKAHIAQSGSGDVEALNFTAESVKVQKSGSGNAYITVTEVFSVSSSGSGNVYYRGEPEKQNIAITGSSKVIKQ
jgi:hypothetical protein